MDPRPPNRPGRPDTRTSSPEEKEQARAVSLRRIGALFAPHRGPLSVVVVTIVASSIVGMASPFLLREVIDVALPQRDVTLLAWLAGGMVAVAAVTAALGVAQTWISTRIGQEVMHGLRTGVFAHLQRQSLAFFTRTRTGEVQSRITNDIGGMQSVVTNTATSVASNLTTTVATLVAMLALSWQLTLVSLVVLPPAILLTRRVARTRRAITAAQQRELADLNVTVEESLSVDGVALSKTLGSGPELTRRFTTSSSRLIGLELRSQLAGRWTMAVTQVVFAAVPAVIYLAAGLPFAAGTMSIGTLVAFTALQGGLFRPVMGLLSVGVQIVASLALFARIFEYLDLTVDVVEPEYPVAVDHDRVRGHVRLEGVTFAYPGSDAAAVAGIDLDVPAGTTLALVGETGSGKTTLAGLVARLHDPTAGRVTIDGVDLRDMAAADLTRIVGVVGQDTYLLHATVRENLRHARPDATDAEIEAAARRAGPRPDHRPARRLRHRRRLARAPLLRRGEAAHRDRPHAAARPEGAGPRRGHQRAGHPHRARRAGRVRRAGPRPYDDHHRAPALDRARRRPDRRRRPRPDRRVRQPRRAARRRGPLRRAGHGVNGDRVSAYATPGAVTTSTSRGPSAANASLSAAAADAASDTDTAGTP